jgi:hypothetical protein
MNETARPKSITVICVLGAIAIALGAFFLAVADVRAKLDEAGSWALPYYVISLVVTAICVVLLWRMEALGLHLYAASTAVGIVVSPVTHTFSPLGLILPAVVIVFGYKNLGKMRAWSWHGQDSGVATAVGTDGSLATELERLTRRHDDGAISDAEFLALKGKLLNRPAVGASD